MAPQSINYVRIPKLILLISLLSAAINSSLGQGTVLFTWHGNSNFFQASFMVTAAEMQPGGHFTSQTFYDSISVDSLSGVHYSYGTTGIADGDSNPFSLSIDLVDFGRSTEVHLGAGDDFQGIIDEKPFSGSSHLYTELGYWTYSYVPEPSAISLAMVGAGLWLATKRRKSRH
jgi:hypothetical protein